MFSSVNWKLEIPVPIEPRLIVIFHAVLKLSISIFVFSKEVLISWFQYKCINNAKRGRLFETYSWDDTLFQSAAIRCINA